MPIITVHTLQTKKTANLRQHGWQIVSLEFDNFPNLFKVGIVEKDEKGNETTPVNPNIIAAFKV